MTCPHTLESGKERYKSKDKVHRYTGTEVLYRPCGL